MNFWIYLIKPSALEKALQMKNDEGLLNYYKAN